MFGISLGVSIIVLVAVCPRSELASSFSDDPRSFPQSNQPFDACRPVNALDQKSKKGAVERASKTITACGYKLITKKQIFKKEVVTILPQLMRKVCVIFCVGYNKFSTAPNRIAPGLAKNASAMMDLFEIVVTVL